MAVRVAELTSGRGHGGVQLSGPEGVCVCVCVVLPFLCLDYIILSTDKRHRCFF